VLAVERGGIGHGLGLRGRGAEPGEAGQQGRENGTEGAHVPDSRRGRRQEAGTLNWFRFGYVLGTQ
jgi:hypothetical protein